MDPKKRLCWLRLVLCVGLILGVVLTVLGSYLSLSLESLLKRKVKEGLAIRKCTEAGSRFEEPPLSTLAYVILFNVTNPDEVNEGLAKPKLKEVGPFVYSLSRRKLILKWDTIAGTVTYKERPTFHFLSSESIGDPKDYKIYHINAPDVAIGNHIAPIKLSSLFTASKFLSMSFGVNLGPLVIEHTASQLLFEGYRVDLLDFLQDRVGKYVTIPRRLPNNTFGLFYGKNHTYGNEISILSGVDDISNLGSVVEYNHTRVLPYWLDNSTCNELRGTDGTFFAPFLDKSQWVYVFSPELCRSLRMSYQETTTVRGIEVFRYGVPEDDYAASLANRCYCLAEDITECQGSGVLSIKTCLNGAPVALSSPHFYQAEPFYAESFDGLNQTDKKHATFADIDPITGLVMRGQRRLQINVEITKQYTIPFLSEVDIKFFPFAYISEVGEVNEALASDYLWRVGYPIKYGGTIVTAMFAIGVATLTLTLIALIVLERRTRNPKLSLRKTATSNGTIKLKDLEPLKA